MVVCGTGTGVGKTFVTAALAVAIKRAGVEVAARKPVQSYAPEDRETDVGRLAEATAEDPSEVGRREWSYPAPLAPPMAAELLGRQVPTIAEIAASLSSWRDRPGVTLVESVGGVRSPLGSDGDSVDLIGVLAPDLVVIVAVASLGVLNAVRLTADALVGAQLVVHLNRFDDEDLQRRNRAWLERWGYLVTADPSKLSEIVLAARPGGTERQTAPS